MSTEDRSEEVSYREDTTEEYSFDDLARGLANGAISRERVLKVVGAALLGGVLSTAFPGLAEARRRRHRRRRVALPPSPPAPVCPAPAACPFGCCASPELVENTCRQGTEDRFCGRGGEPCQECEPGQRCFNQRCVCDAASCPNGCCDANGLCHDNPTQTDQFCGRGGSACQTCGTAGGCVNGECQTCPVGVTPCGAGTGGLGAPACCPEGTTCCGGGTGLSPTCCQAGQVCCAGPGGSSCCSPIVNPVTGGLVSADVQLVCLVNLAGVIVGGCSRASLGVLS